MSDETLRELAVVKAKKNSDELYDKVRCANSYLIETKEYKKACEIRESIYNPSIWDHWRLTYKTFEEALQEETNAWNAMIATEEYKIYKEAQNLYKEAKELYKEAQEEDEKYFAESKS